MTEWICPKCGARIVRETLSGPERIERHERLGCNAPAVPVKPILLADSAVRPAGTQPRKYPHRKQKPGGW